MKDADTTTHVAVRVLLERYLAMIDEKDWAGIASCFSDDSLSYYDGRPEVLVGGAAVAEFIRNAIGGLDGTVHAMGSVRVRLSGQTAHARSTALVSLPRADRGVIVSRAIVYADELRLEPGGWVLTRRVHSPLWQTETPQIPPTLA